MSTRMQHQYTPDQQHHINRAHAFVKATHSKGNMIQFPSFSVGRIRGRWVDNGKSYPHSSERQRLRNIRKYAR